MSKTRTNEEWLRDLNADGDMQEAAIVDLRDLLLRATLYFFHRNLSDFQGRNRDEILQRAEDGAQEALIAVMNHLSDFRGDSKFTTWAYKFAINIALMTSRRERWKNISLDQFSQEEENPLHERMLQDESAGSAPDQSALQGEVGNILREVIEHDLTDKQRQILIMMVFHEVPMDEVVRKFGTNRNAIYKMLHDARRKLKSSLQARGFEVGETLALFGAPR
ncbi:MAG TPA: sigma-70 family RNA polymerase sigma factor [Anaerolineales bacterium]|jgi:RNA polymerase sigma-70 factor (ECF subfamily)|nr:sigma-70 family RNA polymerase sigma factor [Anaerolineales bacterium]